MNNREWAEKTIQGTHWISDVWLDEVEKLFAEHEAAVRKRCELIAVQERAKHYDGPARHVSNLIVTAIQEDGKTR